MPRYLDTRGNATLAIAICDRCKRKRPYDALVSDLNTPGLRVCKETCNDLYDPWRLPARKTEDITLDHPRPDEPLVVSP